jgi:hypothetical protein
MAGIVAAALAATACGKKGNPLPPLRPVPARIADLTVARTAGKVELRFTIPATNADGTTPVAVDRVDIYALAVKADEADAIAAAKPGAGDAPPANGAAPTIADSPRASLPVQEASPTGSPTTPPATAVTPGGGPGTGRSGITKPPVPPAPTAAQIAADSRNLRQSQPVRRPTVEGEPQTPATTLVPAPGEVAVVVDSTVDAEASGAVALYYVAIPVAGLGRGRPGQASVIARVPLKTPPVPPAAVSLTNNETQMVVTWKPSGTGQGFRVFRSSALPGTLDTALTAAPVTGTEFTLPVEFGREVCVSVRAVEVSGPVTVEGTDSEPSCLTPVDRYPPAAPVGVRVVQEGTAVTVIWEAVEAADLAGYVVMRGEGATPMLQPLMPEPLNATTYRDATAQAGVAYTYAVRAVDRAEPPNVSELSVRETITVR